jgi:hypothetical protein
VSSTALSGRAWTERFASEIIKGTWAGADKESAESPLKMKLVSITFFAATLVLSFRLPVAGALLPVFFGAAFGAYGIAMSFAKHFDPLNDSPNALRVFLASLGGYLVPEKGSPRAEDR